MKRMKTVAIGMLAMVACSAAIASPQMAAASEVADPRIAAVMAEVPGGIVVDESRAVWPALGMEMIVPGDVSVFAVGACATGKVCAFDGYNTGGAQLNWSTCGTFSVSAFTVRSIADARSTGYLQARNGTTVVATANAGRSANVYSAVTNVRCVS